MASAWHLKNLVSGGLIVNYQCTSACRHCLYASSPRRDKAYITPETARSNLSRIRSLGCRSVHIGGGEPFIHVDGLKAVLREARSVGVCIDYIETNSSWFGRTDTAVETLGNLRRLGVDTLLVSISPFHNEFIPYRKVRGVIDACRQAGLRVFPWIADFQNDLAGMDEQKPHPLQDYIDRFGPDYMEQAAERYGLNLGGRAAVTYQKFIPRRSCKEVEQEQPCRMRLSDVYHSHVDLYGNYLPGLCTGLSVAVGDIGQPADPDRYPILHLLYTRGISGLRSWAEEEHGFEPDPGGYITACDLCQQLRGFLVLEREVDSPDLQPREFYSELKRA